MKTYGTHPKMKGRISMKRFLCCLVSLAVLLLALVPAALAESTSPTLQFGEQEDFKVLIIADTQDTSAPQMQMIHMIENALDRTQPDLVILLGDNIHGPSISDKADLEKALHFVLDPICARNIPFAFVYGNHDDQCGISREDQMKIYQEYPGCLAIEGEDLPGCGNYCVTVGDPAQPDNVYALYLLDSGTVSADGSGYGCVTAEQNAWMLENDKQLKETYTNVASFAFQHIPVPKVYDLTEDAPASAPGAFTSVLSISGDWHVAKEGALRAGRFGEYPCASAEDSGEFDAWKQMGLKAAFTGHDHLNDFVGNVEGIDLIGTTGAGFYLYGRDEDHGVRLLTLSKESFGEYDTEMIYYPDLNDEPMPGFFASTLGIMIRGYVLIGLAVILVLAVGIPVAVKAIRKHKKAKA